MLFNSFRFAVFMPAVFIIYMLVPKKYRWICILASSYIFYACFNPTHVLVLVAVTLISYLAAIGIEKSAEKSRKKRYLILAIVPMIAALLVFKYFKALPVGISFYMFQTLGYVIDVYRGEVETEHHLGYYASFVSFFPQLASGPISRTKTLLPQLKYPNDFDYNRAVSGIVLILMGFYKKLVVADTLKMNVDIVFNSIRDYKGGALFLASIFYTMQIYCDFSGYSDIAIGLSKIMGIDLKENFRSPYLATSVKEFWGRWHISLSTWFRDYVYIPLGGNRCSKLRRDLNLMITFLVSGLWHGMDMTFIIWGFVHGLGQVVENHLPFLNKKITGIAGNAVKVIRGIVVFFFVNLAWVFFRADTVSDAVYCIGNMFSGITSPGSFIKNAMGDIDIPGNIRLVYLLLIIVVLVIIDIFNYKGTLTDILLKCPRIVRIVVCSCFAAFLFLFAQKGVAAEFVYIQF